MSHDLVIRGGTVVDGTGAEPFQADVAIKGDQIVEIGKVSGKGKQEILANGTTTSLAAIADRVTLAVRGTPSITT